MFGIRLIPLPCAVISCLIAVDLLITCAELCPKYVDVVTADLPLLISTLAPSMVPKCQCPVQHKLHIAGTGCLFGCQTDLLRQVAGRNHLLCCCHIVILHKYYLQPSGQASGSAAMTLDTVSNAWIMSLAMI